MDPSPGGGEMCGGIGGGGGRKGGWPFNRGPGIGITEFKGGGRGNGVGLPGNGRPKPGNPGGRW